MESFEVNNIFSITPDGSSFDNVCLQLFRFQYGQNAVYRQWCDLMQCTPDSIKTPAAIPALPISFFKSHSVTSTSFTPELVFESSGTTGAQTSRHFVKDASIYRESFLRAFRMFYGEPKDWCVIGLLPSYLERQHSSLVYMVDKLIKMSGHACSGFYLNDHERLAQTLARTESEGQRTILIGVTFGLLDFAAAYPQQLNHTIVMETGGMKGRRRELTREEVHQQLQNDLGLSTIHSEYGMTELLSQAYSAGKGRFICPPWMRVLVRSEEDPLQVSTTGRGLLEIIDLANCYSCAFIATDDVGQVFADGSFEVWGRLDHSDIRGCSLLVR